MIERFMGTRLGDGVLRHALGSAPATLAILLTVHDAAFQPSPIRLKTLRDGRQAEVVKLAKRGQVRGVKVSVGLAEVFRISGLGTAIIGKPSALTWPRRGNAPILSIAKSRFDGGVVLRGLAESAQ